MTVDWTQLIEEHAGEPIADWILRRRRPSKPGGRYRPGKAGTVLVPAMTWPEIAAEIATITGGAVTLTDEALRKRFVHLERNDQAAS